MKSISLVPLIAAVALAQRYECGPGSDCVKLCGAPFMGIIECSRSYCDNVNPLGYGTCACVCRYVGPGGGRKRSEEDSPTSRVARRKWQPWETSRVGGDDNTDTTDCTGSCYEDLVRRAKAKAERAEETDSVRTTDDGASTAGTSDTRDNAASPRAPGDTTDCGNPCYQREVREEGKIVPKSPNPDDTDSVRITAGSVRITGQGASTEGTRVTRAIGRYNRARERRSRPVPRGNPWHGSTPSDEDASTTGTRVTRAIPRGNPWHNAPPAEADNGEASTAGTRVTRGVKCSHGCVNSATEDSIAAIDGTKEGGASTDGQNW